MKRRFNNCYDTFHVVMAGPSSNTGNNSQSSSTNKEISADDDGPSKRTKKAKNMKNLYGLRT